MLTVGSLRCDSTPATSHLSPFFPGFPRVFIPFLRPVTGVLLFVLALLEIDDQIGRRKNGQRVETVGTSLAGVRTRHRCPAGPPGGRHLVRDGSNRPFRR